MKAKAGDLTGKAYGQLTVLAETETIVPAKKTAKKIRNWLCKCNKCGREEVIPASKLPSVPSREKAKGVLYCCTICSRGACEICDSEILTSTYRGVCSEACWIERKREQGRRHKREQANRDPLFNKRNNQKKMEKIKSDPAAYAAYLEKEKMRSKKRLEDKEKADRINALARKRYAERADEILDRRKQRKAALPEEQRLLKQAKTRNKQREYKARNELTLAETQKEKWDSLSEEERNEIRRERNEKARIWKAQKEQEKALKELMGIGSKLIDKLESDDDE